MSCRCNVAVLSSSPKVAAVIPTYNADLARLGRVIAAVSPQVAQVFIVDDGSPGGAPKGLAGSAELIALASNSGMAAALNRGAKAARATGATHFLFLDQDSVAPKDLVERLTAELSADASLAAVGPSWVDARRGRRNARGGAASFLILSGMLVPAPVYEKLGGFDESLGVDSVDVEWCFRARAAGYGLRQVRDVTLDHRIGDEALPGGWTRHKPERLYSMMRNRVMLYRRPYIPWRWKMVDLLRAGGKLFMFSVVFPPRRENLCHMLRGLRDGVQLRSR